MAWRWSAVGAARSDWEAAGDGETEKKKIVLTDDVMISISLWFDTSWSKEYKIRRSACQ